MRYLFLMPLLAVIAAAFPASAAPVTPGPGAEGIWMNPRGTVAVHTGACGQGPAAQALCGRIVWASSEAQVDAKDGATPHLLGTELLENYRQRGRGVWQGTVFIPDLGRRFMSEIDQLSPASLRIKGCILGGLLCRSQVWTRIAQVPA